MLPILRENRVVARRAWLCADFANWLRATAAGRAAGRGVGQNAVYAALRELSWRQSRRPAQLANPHGERPPARPAARSIRPYLAPPGRSVVRIVKFGVVPPYAPQNYQSDMPAFKDKLSDAEIQSILEYIKSTWPKDILAEQQEITKNASD